VAERHRNTLPEIRKRKSKSWGNKTGNIDSVQTEYFMAMY
jgi:hypothetical protein